MKDLIPVCKAARSSEGVIVLCIEYNDDFMINAIDDAVAGEPTILHGKELAQTWEDPEFGFVNSGGKFFTKDESAVI